MTWRNILKAKGKSSFFSEEQMRRINRGRKKREKEELRFKRQNRNPRDSKKVRDAEVQELEEEFGSVTDSPSFGQPQPKGKTQQRKGTVGVRRSRNTPPVKRRGAKARKGGRKIVPENPFRLEGDKK